ncbi:aldose 1-epimerase family protein [Mucilaginibacter koreensis]
MTVIENEYLRVTISPQGAQLTSIYNKAAQIEQLWQANPQVWPWHAPNLFPVVGGLVNNQLRVNGQDYHLPRHGFARQSEFRVAETGKHHALFSLHYNESTLVSYPYKFSFQVMYDLIENALRVTYKVLNHDQQPVYFSVGGHPAFNVPFSAGENYEDYYLEFEMQEALETHLLSAEGYFTGQTQPVKVENKCLPLTRELFNQDALVFKNMQSRQVCIKSTRHEHSLTVEFPHFNYLGLWAKPGADFVCIEPWLGCADAEGFSGNISEKEGIQKLVPGHVFEAAYYISI